MAKGQKRSNREAKKPKQPKQQRSETPSHALALGPAARDSAPVGRRDGTGSRNGRR